MEPPKLPPDPDPNIENLSDREIIIQLLQQVKTLEREVKSLKEELRREKTEKTSANVNQRILQFENHSRQRTNSTTYNENFPIIQKNNDLNLRPQYQRKDKSPSDGSTQAPKVHPE